MLILTSRYSHKRNRRMFILYTSKVFSIRNDTFHIPKGYEFDGASIPRFLWWVFAPHGKAFESACLHDWLYDTMGKGHYYTRKQVDDVFLDHMEIDKVPLIQRWLYYGAVRAFGWYMWNRYSLPEQFKYMLLGLFMLTSCQTASNLSVNPYFIVKEQRGEYVKVESPSTKDAPYMQVMVIHWPEFVAKGDTLYLRNK